MIILRNNNIKVDFPSTNFVVKKLNRRYPKQKKLLKLKLHLLNYNQMQNKVRITNKKEQFQIVLKGYINKT